MVGCNELSELGLSGVSTNQTLVYSQITDSLFVGDLVHYKTHAWLEGGIVDGQAKPSLDTWITALDVVSDLYPAETIILGGRGSAARLKEAVAEQMQYLKIAEEIVRDYVSGLGKQKSELFGDEASVHHSTLTQRFQTQFPSYELTYMIQYGIYGLANQIASK